MFIFVSCYHKGELSFKQLLIRFDLETTASKMLNDNHVYAFFLVRTCIIYTATLIKRDYSFVDI